MIYFLTNRPIKIYIQCVHVLSVIGFCHTVSNSIQLFRLWGCWPAWGGGAGASTAPPWLRLSSGYSVLFIYFNGILWNNFALVI